jgi:phosphoglycerate kinase
MPFELSWLADLTFVSTRGGAFLEWMEGRTLSGVAALQQQG